MVELDNLKIELNNYENDLDEIKSSLNLDYKYKRLDEIEHLMQEPDFWNDIDKANELNKEIKRIKDDIENYDNLKRTYEDIYTMIDLAVDLDDNTVLKEITQMYSAFVKKINDVKTSLLLSGEYDGLDAIVRLNAGSGGTESCDFCQMLYRMYSKYASNKSFEINILDFLEGDEAGIKSVSFLVKGQYAYGYLKSETGVHRLVRMSPFNAQGKRQTSFVSCDVMPDIKEDLNININDEDLRVDYFRASGAGGQHVNKTSSAVRITHIPTGIVVACQEERSQLLNKNRAMQMLKAKLYIIKQKENETKLSNIRGEVKDNAFGSQIRSYVLQPYRLVKDLRTGDETGNTDAVLDGDIDIFITGYLKWLQLGCPDRKIKSQED